MGTDSLVMNQVDGLALAPTRQPEVSRSTIKCLYLDKARLVYLEGVSVWVSSPLFLFEKGGGACLSVKYQVVTYPNLQKNTIFGRLLWQFAMCDLAFLGKFRKVLTQHITSMSGPPYIKLWFMVEVVILCKQHGP